MFKGQLRSTTLRSLRTKLWLHPLERRITPVNVTNVLVNDQTADTGYTDTQSTTSTIVFPNSSSGVTVLTGFNDLSSVGIVSDLQTGWSRSTDGGQSFTDLGLVYGGGNGEPSMARDQDNNYVYL